AATLPLPGQRGVMPRKALKTNFVFCCHQLGAGQADVIAEQLSRCFYLCMVTAAVSGLPATVVPRSRAERLHTERLGHGIWAEHLSVCRMLSSQMIARTYRY